MMRTTICVTLLLCLCGGVLAQSQGPSFDVASLKLVPDSPEIPKAVFAGRRLAGGRFTWAATREPLVAYAFGLPAWRVQWMEHDRSFYSVEATTDPAATEDQVRLMLQKLLVDRFKLSVHHESKELQGYALVVAGREAKVKPAKPGADVPMPEYLKGKPAPAFDGRIFLTMEGIGTSAITGRGVPMSRLADTLSDALNTFVLEKTGMTGNYYFGFRFLSDVAVSNPDVPSIFAALQDETGLKLEKQKAPIDILVIDRMEKVPIEN